MRPQNFKEEKVDSAGLTLVELLIALAIAAMLSMVLIPAVQAVRSAARRTQCEDNLHQLSMAIHAFEGRAGKMPHFDQYWRGLLNDLEQTPLQRALETSEPVEVHVPVLQCPADDWAVDGSAFVSYLGNAGSHSRSVRPSTGILNFFGGAVPFSSITDGLSNTAMVSERLIDRHASPDAIGDSNSISRLPRRFLWFIPTPIIGAGRENELVASCIADRSIPVPYARAWTSRIENLNQGYDHLLPPNAVGCLNGNASGYDPWDAIAPATSLHAGGVNLAMCDGRVAFLSENVSLSAWRDLGTIAGGNTASY